jgi:hypothetical protein
MAFRRRGQTMWRSKYLLGGGGGVVGRATRRQQIDLRPDNPAMIFGWLSGRIVHLLGSRWAMCDVIG